MNICYQEHKKEMAEMLMIKTLVYAGVNINANERCGATALTLAVTRRMKRFVNFFWRTLLYLKTNFPNDP